VQVGGQLPFQPEIASPGAAVAAELVGEAGGQEASQPGAHLRLALALEVGKVAVRFHEGLLDQIGGLDLAAQVPAQLHAGQERQVAAVTLQDQAAGLGVAGAGAAKQLLSRRTGCGHRRGSSYYLGEQRGSIAPRRGPKILEKSIRLALATP